MRYYIRDNTLFLRGHFRAAGTGTPGGLRPVPTIVVHGPPAAGDEADSLRILERAVRREGLPPDFFGVFAGAHPSRLCILQYDSLMVFIAPGPGDGSGGGFSIVVYSGEGLSDAALLGALVTATAARMAVLCGRDGAGRLESPQDTLVVACEGEVVHADASPSSAIGLRIGEAVRFGTRTVMERSAGSRGPEKRPSFFIYSRYQGDHWAEWVPEECPYYPCHFPGQRCDFCYCPFYPCGDESLGQWVQSSAKNGLVWNCSTCTLLHEPAIADYLLAHPEASLRELKAKKAREKK
ncbi:MAG TPA: cysteine-rich small domain-containing protein [Methanolinea sp.]|jgi:adenosylcobinamide hydrolase|nr:cysteine-rich small domain-containing protein [Methanolinea sp.]